MRELETINQYQDFFEAAEDPTIKELMGHLMFEEKEHVAELTEMLKRYDADQLAHFHGEHAARIGEPHEAGGTVPVGGSPAKPEPKRRQEGTPKAALPEPTSSETGSSDPLPDDPPFDLPVPAPVRGAEPLTVGSLLGLPQR